MAKVYRVGSRTSFLALSQTEEFLQALKKFHPRIKAKVIGIDTYGDKDKNTPLREIEGSDFFTREIEEALLKGKIDMAVHSAKDLEKDTPPGLVIAALTASRSPFECLVSRGNKKLNELSQGALVGTSSLKRRAALLKYRPDLKVCDLRGTIEERIFQLDRGRFDAVIVAHAALLRLGYVERIAEIISPEIIPPHPLQGSLAIQVRARDRKLLDLLSPLNKETSDENKN